jgi:hypothetical protein
VASRFSFSPLALIYASHPTPIEAEGMFDPYVGARRIDIPFRGDKRVKQGGVRAPFSERCVQIVRRRVSRRNAA